MKIDCFKKDEELSQRGGFGMIANLRLIAVVSLILYGGGMWCCDVSAQDDVAVKPEPGHKAQSPDAAQAKGNGDGQQVQAPNNNPSAVLVAEDAKRKERCEKAEQCVKDAKQLASQGKFKEANAKFKEADSEFEQLGGDYVALKRKQLQGTLVEFRRRWAMSLMSEAYNAFADKDYDVAALKARDAQSIKGITDARKNEIKKFVFLCEKRMASVDFVQKTALDAQDVDPDNKKRHYEMDVALKNARQLMDDERYMDARDMLEKILVRDPYNAKASHLLAMLYKNLTVIGDKRRENDRLERLGEVQWKWVEPVLPVPAKRPEDLEPVKESGMSSLSEKMASMVIDDIAFDRVDIQSAVRFLKQQSQRIDPDHLGVNIILSLSNEELASVPRLTLTLREVPLTEVVRYMCQKCGLRYRVQDQALVIGTSAIDPMEMRFFKVRAALIQRIAPPTMGEGGEGGEGAGGMALGEDFFDPNTTFGTGGTGAKGQPSTRHSVTSDKLKAYFEERGVPFPEGSTIAYNKRSSRLAVNNTPENLRRLDMLLRALDLEQPQVLVESKFVEIDQRDIEEFGFEWWMNKKAAADPSRAQTLSEPWVIAANDSLVRPLGISKDGVASPVNSTALGKIINNLQMPALGPDNTFNINMILHALDKSSTTEVLSAPKVIAKSGNEATIKMVQEYYFPESWTEAELNVINGGVQYTPPNPEFGEPTDVGIRLTVTPEVSPDYHTIKMALNPQVLAFVAWTVYPISYRFGGSVGSDPVKMAEISRRDVQVNVKTYDGDTLVLGGMLRENASGSDDSFPGTDHVPLLGWAGRMQTSDKRKRNLMVFVTARIVNPDGLPIRLSPDNGRFDFRR